MPKATIDDVAELAGVSIKTVSRVVNREPNVRETTRDKVEKAIAKLHYRPNQSARNLASQHAHLIGLIYDDPSAYEIPSAGYVIRLQEGSLRACKSANYELLIHPCNIRNKQVTDELKAFIEQVRPAGIIIAAPLSNMAKIVRAISSTGTPYVRLSPGQSNGGQYAVRTNDREISAQMTRYLASLGHKRVAFIKGHPDHKAVTRRFDGYLDGLEQSGLRFSQNLVGEGDNSFGSGEAAANKLLKRKKRPTAIFAANDDMAAGVMRVADRLNVDVPGQLSVAGCDDISLAQQIFPRLTTIRQPLSSIAERAALALIESYRTRSSLKGSEVVPAKLVIRDSTGPVPSDA
ncbi:MAG: LacI family DNA-binding transcriptional regulator [Pseudomonadota bacterium]